MPRNYRNTLALLGFVTGGVIGFLGVTAFQGTTITLPAPSGNTALWGVFILVFTESTRRMLKRLDTAVEQVTELAQNFGKFKSRMEDCLLGFDGQGGLLNEQRDLCDRISAIEEDHRDTSPPQVGSYQPPKVKT